MSSLFTGWHMARIARAVPVVVVKSRHRDDCKYRGDGNRITCSCPKQLIWSLQGKEHRISADSCDYQIAEQKARELEQSFELAAKAIRRSELGLPPEESTQKIERSTVEDAVTKFLGAKKTENIGRRHTLTLKSTFAKSLVSFCHAHGIMYLRDIKLDDLEAWRGTWKLGKTTAQKTQSRVGGFFDYCLRRGWIDKNPTLGLGKIRIKSEDRRPTIALDDKQFQQLLDSIDKINGLTTDEQRGRFRALVLLQRWTGLSITDAIKLERHRIEPNEEHSGWYRLFLKRAKTGTPVYAAISPAVAQEILNATRGSSHCLFSDKGTKREVNNAVKRYTDMYVRLDKVAILVNERGEKLWVHSHTA
jgi:site-specific recombinase XerC